MISLKLVRLIAVIAMVVGAVCGQAQSHVEYTQVVQTSGVSISLVSTKNPSNIGDGSAVVVKVSGSGVLPPSGVITFSATPIDTVTGTTVSGVPVTLDSSGSASWVFNLNPGTYQILATYGGDSEYQPGESATLQQVVIGPADFTLTLDPGSLVVKEGATWSGSLTATSVNNFQGIVTLTCTGTDSAAGVACVQGQPQLLTPGTPVSFPITVTTTGTVLNVINGSSVLLIGFGFASARRRRNQMKALALLCLLLFVTGCGTVRYEQKDGTPRGDYKMTFTGQSGALSHSVSFTVSVQ